MSTSFMTQAQRFLAPGTAFTVAATGHARQLRVRAGRVWLTLTGGGLSDHWLDAGDELALPAGAEAVLEGWPSAQFELLQAQPAARGATHNARHVRAAVSPAPRPAA
jgi:hypothetical protein